MTIEEKARELGVALAGTEEYKRMLAAQVSVNTNESLKALMSEFNLKRSAMVEMLQKGDYESSLAVEMSADIDRLQAQMSENPLFSEMLEAEKRFSDLLTMVDREINNCIGSNRPSFGGCDAGCGGDCGSCGGCGNAN